MTTILTIKEAGLIRERKAFDTHFVKGYVSEGGTYIVASTGVQSDSGQTRDLAAILPGDIGQGRVVQIYFAASPELITEIEAAIA